MVEGAQRRLAAIVSADVVGYSRLMQADEAGTHARLKTLYLELVAPKIEAFGGRVVKLMGDGLLAEFPSIVSAAEWAIETQNAVAAASQTDPLDRRIEYRVGVSLGDVIVDGDDLYGDGVNLAARLQEIAAPGGVCLSDDAYRQLRGKVRVTFTDGGEVSLKNWAGPLRVWRWNSSVTETADALISPKKCDLALSHKPSIAVLPFANMSQDPEQAFFADGITEDITTILSRFRHLTVVSRNSAFTYKGRAVEARQAARELNAQYVLEGSVRRAGNRIRITAQLIDAVNDRHVWAERYDRDLDDIFAVQDEIATAISATVAPEIGQAELEEVQRRPPSQLDAWATYQQGLWLLQHFTYDTIVAAKPLFQQAIELDPNFAAAHAGLAHALLQEWFYGGPSKRGTQLEDAASAIRQAIALDHHDAQAYVISGRILARRGDYAEACVQCRKAIELNPALPQAYFGLGDALLFLRQFDEALAMFEMAIRLGPRDPLLWTFYNLKGMTLIGLRRHEAAADAALQALSHPHVDFYPHLVLASALAHLGREADAKRAVRQALGVERTFTCDRQRRQFPVSDDFTEHFIDGLRKAGVPE